MWVCHVSDISVMIKSVTGVSWERKVSKNDVNVIRKVGMLL